MADKWVRKYDSNKKRMTIFVPGGNEHRWWEIHIGRGPFTYLLTTYPYHTLLDIEYILMWRESGRIMRKNFTWRQLTQISEVSKEWVGKTKAAKMQVTIAASDLARELGQKGLLLNAPIFNASMSQVAVLRWWVYFLTFPNRRVLFRHQ